MGREVVEEEIDGSEAIVETVVATVVVVFWVFWEGAFFGDALEGMRFPSVLSCDARSRRRVFVFRVTTARE